tara:strand:- start:32858 stop:33811 length:954 start_codon:yes stop_codon:yes gene_type:complete
MENLINIISRAYLLYTLKNDKEIAQHFFQEFDTAKKNSDTIFTKKQFFNRLINELNLLIKKTNNKSFKYNIPQNVTSQVLDDYYRYIDEEEYYSQVKYNEYKDRLTESDQLIPNWETVNNAESLKLAMDDFLIKLKDPVAFINPSKEVRKTTMVLRKSKLEFLKTEAIKARDANNINDLDNEKELDKNNHSSKEVTSENDLVDIEGFVREHFKFTLDINDRKKKAMLSEEDYLKLVKWVTYFFKKKYELPYIETPIMNVNIGKTRMKVAFNKLIQVYHPSRPKPISFYELVSKCFYVFKDETRDSIQKTSDPDKLDN